MMHELTQSAAWLRWFEEYPYGYYHGDTTPFRSKQPSPHQLFSSGGVLTSLVRGLLGLTGDATQKILSFNPHLPPSWNQVRVRRYRIGNDLFNLLVERSAEKWHCTIEGGSKGYQLKISPALGLLASVRSAKVAGAVQGGAGWDQSQSNSEDSHYLITAKAEGNSRTEVELDCRRGIELDTPTSAFQSGDGSRNLRILSVRNQRDKVIAEIEGLSGQTYAMRVWTELPILAVKGGRFVQSEPKSVEVSFPPGDPRRFSRSTLEIEVPSKR